MKKHVGTSRSILNNIEFLKSLVVKSGGYDNEDYKEKFDNVFLELSSDVKSLEEETMTSFLIRQRELMNLLDIPPGPVDDIIGSSLYKDVLIMLGGEVHEALEPLTVSTKPWKQINKDELRNNSLEELIDVFFFFLEALELAGIDASKLNELYEEKRQRNFRRQAGTTSSVVLIASEGKDNKDIIKVKDGKNEFSQNIDKGLFIFYFQKYLYSARDFKTRKELYELKREYISNGSLDNFEKILKKVCEIILTENEKNPDTVLIQNMKNTISSSIETGLNFKYEDGNSVIILEGLKNDDK